MSEERIFPATPQRLAAARREGRVARSASVTSVAALLAAAGGLWWLGGRTFDSLGWFVRQQLTSAGEIQDAERQLLTGQWLDLGWLAALVVPLLVCVLVVSMLANLAQGGLIWAPQRIAPDGSRLWNSQRLTATFSLARIVDVLIELAKLTVCFGVAGWGLWRAREQLVIGQGDLLSGVSSVMQAVCAVAIQVVVALGVISLGEYAVLWWRHRQSLRMTAQEWQAEMQERDAALHVRKTRPFAGQTTTGERAA